MFKMKKSNQLYFNEKLFSTSEISTIIGSLKSCPKTSKFKCSHKHDSKEREEMFNLKYPCVRCWRNELLNNDSCPKITLKDLIDRTSINKVWCEFKKNYPKEYHNKKAFENIMHDLYSYTPAISDSIITIEKEVEDDSEEWHHLYTFQPKEMETSFCMGFCDWREWLGTQIDNFVFTKYTDAQIIAHCYWEMTFYGYSNKDIEKVKEEVFDVRDEYESRKGKTVNIDEL